MSKYLVRNISLPLHEKSELAIEYALKKVRKLGIVPIGGKIYKKSVDVRDKSRPVFVYSITVETPCDASCDEIMEKAGFVKSQDGEVPNVCGIEPLKYPIGIIGFGPSGMFSALCLSERGYPVTVFERGDDVMTRTKKVRIFTSGGELDTESNVQFGAGGAGTFSDGKLVTRINDPYCRYVLNRFAEFGAGDEILSDAKPHIGTDRLVRIVDGFDRKIREQSGKILYRTKVEDIVCHSDYVTVKTNHGDYPCSCVILALGHSSRDTYEMLFSHGILMEPKPFSVGVRCEHLQADIDRGLYGNLCEKYSDVLPKGEYALSHRENGRGVYTFCMCPGGQVVAAASESGGIVTNGMSVHSRSGINANCAVAVSVLPSDIGNHPLDGIAFQRAIEFGAFNVSKSYHAPAQTLGDFLNNECTGVFSRVKPTYMDGKVIKYDINKLLPWYVCDMLKLGFHRFGKKIRGFDSPDTVLTAPETRTSSPLRIIRNEYGLCIGSDKIYPCGEGAGYAGGITSASVDGIKTAIKIMERYKPN